jgi:hypothetical protein
MSVDDIRWGVEPPPPGSNHRSGRLTCEEIKIAAQMRPDVWGNYEYPNTTQATGYAHRLRLLGLDATSRGAMVFFRWQP